jgi:hypothetical protein
MMKSLPFFLLAALLCLAPRPAAAAYMTGADLLEMCESDKPADIFGCMNYVAGVVDYQLMQQSLGTEPPGIDFCLPDGTTMQAASVVVMRYLRKNPQMGEVIAAPTVPMALHDAYPCGKPKAKKKKRKHG